MKKKSMDIMDAKNLMIKRSTAHSTCRPQGSFHHSTKPGQPIEALQKKP